jgi:hypothetical protein
MLNFIIFCIAVAAWSFFFDALLVRRKDQVATVSFNCFIVTYLLASTESIVYMTDKDGKPLISENILVLRKLFSCIPPVMFNKAVTDISQTAAIGTPRNFKLAAT